jgi:hypothetical protein
VGALGLAAPGCGGGAAKDEGATTTTPTPRQTTPQGSQSSRIDPAILPPPGVPKRATGAADPASVRVINGWLRALREGKIARAASYFAVPSVFQNASPVLTLATRQDVLAVNLSFPCGAVATRFGGAGRYTVVRFKLTSRVGGDCKGGEGNTTSGAIRVAGGRIREWYRVYEPYELKPAPQQKPAPQAGDEKT